MPPWSMSTAEPRFEPTPTPTLEIVSVPTVPPPSAMPTARGIVHADVEAADGVALRELNALVAGAGHHDDRRLAGRAGLDRDVAAQRVVDDEVLALADQRLVVEQVDAVGFGIGAGAQVDDVAGVGVVADAVVDGVERGDRGERIGLGAEVEAARRRVVDEPDRGPRR